MTDREILDDVTLLLRKAREAENGTARGLDDGEPLFGFVLDHHDYMAIHCLLNIEVGADVANVHDGKGSGQA